MTRTLEASKIRFINHHANNHRVEFFGIPVVDIPFHDFLAQLEQHIIRRESTHIVNLNPHHFLIAQKDDEFAEICHSGDIVFSDGIGINFGSILGKKIIQHRFTGLDIMKELTALSADRGYSIYLLGGQDGIGRRCANNLQKEYPSLAIAGVYEPPLANDIGLYDNDEIVRTINAAAPDILFVALGAPKQEKWIERFRTALEVPILMGVGGSFDILGGTFSRAPHWMRKAGLEWLYRLSLEPRRLASRYLLGIPHYLFLVLRLRFRGRKGRGFPQR